MNSPHIELTGAWAIFNIALWVIVACIGVAGLVLACYRVLDYTLRQTLICLKLLDLFKDFMIERMRKKHSRPKSIDPTEYARADKGKGRYPHDK
jgi:hypothetical protein